MARHPTPNHVLIYKEGPPKCCHTCQYYDHRGVCEIHSSEPPEDFASQNGACDEWVWEIPF